MIYLRSCRWDRKRSVGSSTMIYDYGAGLGYGNEIHNSPQESTRYATLTHDMTPIVTAVSRFLLPLLHCHSLLAMISNYYRERRFRPLSQLHISFISLTDSSTYHFLTLLYTITKSKAELKSGCASTSRTRHVRNALVIKNEKQEWSSRYCLTVFHAT
ncbi:hypothetical protein BJX61DRAFT_499962 [Aspergillus egyptiacus]|nr:hypothetical protein BJX61DRAFT_499962 [Aspergillus egyptiacus]